MCRECSSSRQSVDQRQSTRQTGAQADEMSRDAVRCAAWRVSERRVVDPFMISRGKASCNQVTNPRQSADLLLG